MMLPSMNSIKPNNMYAFHSSHQGASHKRKGLVCQDSAFSRFKSNDRYAIAIVSDGHGGKNYFRSDRGSRLAVETAYKSVRGFMENFMKPTSSKDLLSELCSNPDKFMRQLEANILYHWLEKTADDYRCNPFTEAELALMDDDFRRKYESAPDKRYVKAYGATLIAVVIMPGQFWFGLHIGDGKCVAYHPDGTFCQPLPWDDKCFLNVTTSLCDENPLPEFRHCFHTEWFPTAIFVGSDGIDDCFASDHDLYNFYLEVVTTFKEKSCKEAFAEIDSFLPLMSERGSGDDISLSGIITEVQR